MINKAILRAAFVNWQPLTKCGLSRVCWIYSENSHGVYKEKEKKEGIVCKV